MRGSQANLRMSSLACYSESMGGQADTFRREAAVKPDRHAHLLKAHKREIKREVGAEALVQ